MGISTRSKTGSLPGVSRGITKSTVTPRKAKSKAKPTDHGNGTTTPTSSTFPELNLLSDSGNHVATMSLLSNETPGLFLFTYPKANTGGCTTQATGLNAMLKEAKDAGYNIVGVSYDSVKSQAAWKAKHSMQITLLCDTLDIGLLKKLGAHKAPKSTKRSLFIIKKQGDAATIVEKKISISPKDCVTFVKEYLPNNSLVGDKKDNTDKKENDDKPVEKSTEKADEEKSDTNAKDSEKAGKKDEKKDDEPKDSGKEVTTDTMKDV